MNYVVLLGSVSDYNRRQTIEPGNGEARLRHYLQQLTWIVHIFLLHPHQISRQGTAGSGIGNKQWQSVNSNNTDTRSFSRTSAKNRARHRISMTSWNGDMRLIPRSRQWSYTRFVLTSWNHQKRSKARLPRRAMSTLRRIGRSTGWGVMENGLSMNHALLFGLLKNF